MRVSRSYGLRLREGGQRDSLPVQLRDGDGVDPVSGHPDYDAGDVDNLRWAAEEAEDYAIANAIY